MRALIYLPQAAKLQGALQFQTRTALECDRADLRGNEETFQGPENPTRVRS